MVLTELEQKIERDALEFAKKNKSAIAKRATSKDVYRPESDPVSVFMAGSPGAGKTEASIELIERLASDVKVLRIDPDELRKEFPTYSGGNSFLFQRGISVLVERVHDMALKNKQSFLLDGTLSNFHKAKQNIERSLGKKRLVQILYVYQDPLLAWNFVVAREREEGRNIPKKHFIEQYFQARENVNELKAIFSREIRIDLLLKNIDNSHRTYKANIDKIDNFVREKYTPESLEEALNS